jgi:serine phosphatase RsbU (regulator of sigma subunit)
VLFTSITVVVLFKTELEESRLLLSEKNKEIIDSINYAKKIQFTLLAHEEELREAFPNHFVFFQPKDIVSGDFYWSTQIKTKNNSSLFYLAVCDSTGHGVPGAFMSLLNISFLNEAIVERGIHLPNEIFNHVRNRLIESLGKDGQQDGFDGTLLCFELNEEKKIVNIKYAAANNAPILISNKKLIELSCDKMPVGKGVKEDGFKLHEITFTTGDLLCMYTDGYADQFGGEKGKKFKNKNLNQLIVEHSQQELLKLNTILNTTFTQWKGKLEQVDDVCLIGINLN